MSLLLIIDQKSHIILLGIETYIEHEHPKCDQFQHAVEVN